jgi:hypothetical protein
MLRSESMAATREQPPIEPDPVIEAYKRDVDRTLLRENLKQTPDARVRALMRLRPACRSGSTPIPCAVA